MSYSESLTDLLVAESLLLAAFTVALALPGVSRTASASSVRNIAGAIALVITLVGIGAMTAWLDHTFAHASPEGFGHWAAAVAVGVAIVAEPLIAWSCVVVAS